MGGSVPWRPVLFVISLFYDSVNTGYPKKARSPENHRARGSNHSAHARAGTRCRRCMGLCAARSKTISTRSNSPTGEHRPDRELFRPVARPANRQAGTKARAEDPGQSQPGKGHGRPAQGPGRSRAPQTGRQEEGQRAQARRRPCGRKPTCSRAWTKGVAAAESMKKLVAALASLLRSTPSTVPAVHGVCHACRQVFLLSEMTPVPRGRMSCDACRAGRAPGRLTCAR